MSKMTLTTDQGSKSFDTLEGGINALAALLGVDLTLPDPGPDRAADAAWEEYQQDKAQSAEQDKAKSAYDELFRTS